MSLIPAGTEVAYQVTYLRMSKNPGLARPALPDGVRLEQAVDPPVWFFLTLYDAVGRDYEWRDRFEQAKTDPAALVAFVADPLVETWVAYSAGWPKGFFMLDWRRPGTCDLAYFGLVPEAVGTGLGGKLLRTAIATGWARPGIEAMTVNTCDLDHPRALDLYRKAGFQAFRSEFRKRTLFRDRDPSRHPA
jgi:GNAT superfamily N-acetyltransferase